MTQIHRYYHNRLASMIFRFLDSGGTIKLGTTDRGSPITDKQKSVRPFDVQMCKDATSFYSPDNQIARLSPKLTYTLGLRHESQ